MCLEVLHTISSLDVVGELIPKVWGIGTKGCHQTFSDLCVVSVILY